MCMTCSKLPGKGCGSSAVRRVDCTLARLCTESNGGGKASRAWKACMLGSRVPWLKVIRVCQGWGRFVAATSLMGTFRVRANSCGMGGVTLPQASLHKDHCFRLPKQQVAMSAVHPCHYGQQVRAGLLGCRQHPVSAHVIEGIVPVDMPSHSCGRPGCRPKHA
jgi:hypothetical protein